MKLVLIKYRKEWEENNRIILEMKKKIAMSLKENRLKWKFNESLTKGIKQPSQ